ncbi:MAG: hypothetical protein Q8L97_07745 [Nitrosomonas sp.]|uniref:hypothetical protein n=1 Tax=Nitrosomonas sp. TaxID=42353 RepID=UPI00272FA5D7|nr:hypothetical protein [Nitrosomonas sp.]MDP1550038.1 hypothetical protein [Nitrosomonas sp.]
MNSSRIDRVLNNAEWPKQNKIKDIEFQTGDVLLLCGGFEDRAMAILNLAAASKCRSLTVLDFEYTPALKSNHSPQIIKLCEEVNWKHIRIEYDRRDPAGIFKTTLRNFPQDLKRIYLDISGMSRLLVVQLVVGLLRDIKSDIEVSILYTEAASYPPSKSEALAKLSNFSTDSSEMMSFISTGVDIAIVPELSSISINRAPVRLIAFPSFNPAQLFCLKSIIQPAKTTLIHGVPADPELHWRTNIICKMNQISGDSKDEAFNISTLDYSECLKLLLSIYDKWSEFNSLVLSPTGSKMQAVAVGIFRSFIQDIQIIYPTPLHFTNPDEYTLGVRYIYELNLTPFIELNNSLKN